MEIPTHALSWFEIPVADFDRAQRFYESIFEYQMPEFPIDGNRLGILPYDQSAGGVGGAIMVHKNRKPSPDGVLVYLSAGDDLAGVLDRVEPAGGKVLLPKTQITEEIGFFALFQDSEGNRVGLHSKS